MATTLTRVRPWTQIISRSKAVAWRAILSGPTAQMYVLNTPAVKFILTFSQNVHQWGDQWNGEDLSIFSLDDRPLPVGAVPRANAGANPAEDVAVDPSNLRNAITNQSISTSSTNPRRDSQDDLPEPMRTTDRALATPGFRAAEAYVRPSPIAVSGDIANFGFDLRNCTFHVTLRVGKEADLDESSLFFLPEFHFPGTDKVTVQTSGGKWEIFTDEGEVQKLRWWHGRGEQWLKVVGITHRTLNRADGGGAQGGDEGGYFEALQAMANNACIVM